MTARDRIVIMIVVAVAAVAATWLLVIQPKRDEASKLGSQVSSLQSQLTATQQQLAQDTAARSSFASNYTELASLGKAVPADDNVPSLIYQVQGAASAAGVDFRDLVLNPATGGSAPPPPPSGRSPAATQANTATLPPGATVGPAGFPIEPFTFTFQGNFFHLANFFKRLESFVVATNNHISVTGRLMSLNAISFGPAPQGFPQITAAISATTYLVPASQGLENGATPAGPAASSTATSSVSTTSSAAGTPAVVTSPVR